jgi:hypothetical protein
MAVTELPERDAMTDEIAALMLSRRVDSLGSKFVNMGITASCESDAQ